MKKSVIVAGVVCALLIGVVGMFPAEAAGIDEGVKVISFEELSEETVSPDVILGENTGIMTRATSRIEWEIPSKTLMKAGTAYSLEADEVVTINCTYSPRTADLDFGFITPDNTFHFTSGSDGSIKINIQIGDTGKYYFAVRNNTSKTVEVLGYVYY